MIDSTYRSELRDINEINYARFEAKLDQRIETLRAELKADIVGLEASSPAQSRYCCPPRPPRLRVKAVPAPSLYTGTCTRSLMCFRFATIVNVMITSSDHELHLLTCTSVHAPS